MIRYAWAPATGWLSWRDRPYADDYLHYDWNGKLCGGEFVYAHKHSVFPHVGWWICQLCSRKVCGRRIDAFFEAVQKAVTG